MALTQAVSGGERVRAFAVSEGVREQARIGPRRRRDRFLWEHAVQLACLRRRLVRRVLALAVLGDWREGEVVHRLIRVR